LQRQEIFVFEKRLGGQSALGYKLQPNCKYSRGINLDIQKKAPVTLVILSKKSVLGFRSEVN
jgi:hypothetical protein